MMIHGFATSEGTDRFRARYGLLHPTHFRISHGLWHSSLGAGSYLGDPDDDTDAAYRSAFRKAILGGVNVLDTAINYRCQRSERILGRVIAELIEEKKIRRDEMILSTKGGFLPFDKFYPPDPAQYFRQTYVDSGILSADEIVQGCHSLSPQYLENQLEQSRRNLGLETLDTYFLHNPEVQLLGIERSDFLQRMRLAFSWLEEKVREGKIASYGTATWSGYRVNDQARDFLSLQDLLILAREVGGVDHHFRVIQLPFNIAMPEAWVLPNQKFGAQYISMLQLCQKNGLAVLASGSLLQSKLVHALPEDFLKKFLPLTKASQCALQFARSAPGVTTALVGMKNEKHVEENLELAKEAVISEERLVLMFQNS